MMARNHIPFSAGCWCLYAITTQLPLEAEGIMAAMIGGILPDIDHPKSTVGRKLPCISIPISAIFGHRGITHSLLMTIAILFILYVATHFSAYEHYKPLVAPLCLGYLSHIFGDMMTPSGVPLFWPYKRNFSLGLFRTNSWQEDTVVWLFGLGVLGWASYTASITISGIF